MKLRYLAMLCIFCFTSALFGQRLVRFPLVNHAGEVEADLYGSGMRAVVLAHGGSFHKESWKKQAQVLAESGFLVLAIGFRGDGFGPNGSPGSYGPDDDNAADVLAAASYLHRRGARTIFAVGASMGGAAVGVADAMSPGTLARVVFLGSSGGDAPEKLTGRKLFIVAREDKSGSGLRLPEITNHYDRALQPKKLIVVAGSAHAQFLFDTDQGAHVLNEIVAFLSAP